MQLVINLIITALGSRGPGVTNSITPELVFFINLIVLNNEIISKIINLEKINLFKIKSGQTQEEWEEKGWIHQDDPRGWFEWYCKYYIGRRHEDDIRQIKRWLAFCGPKGRFRNAIYNKIFKSGLKIENSKDISPRIQQSLLHWSYIVNNQDYESWKLEKQK